MLFIIVKTVSEGSEGKSTFKVSSTVHSQGYLLLSRVYGGSSDRLY